MYVFSLPKPGSYLNNFPEIYRYVMIFVEFGSELAGNT